jgi:hypothetical protein
MFIEGQSRKVDDVADAGDLDDVDEVCFSRTGLPDWKTWA